MAGQQKKAVKLGMVAGVCNLDKISRGGGRAAPSRRRRWRGWELERIPAVYIT